MLLRSVLPRSIRPVAATRSLIRCVASETVEGSSSTSTKQPLFAERFNQPPLRLAIRNASASSPLSSTSTLIVPVTKDDVHHESTLLADRLAIDTELLHHVQRDFAAKPEQTHLLYRSSSATTTTTKSPTDDIASLAAQARRIILLGIASNESTDDCNNSNNSHGLDQTERNFLDRLERLASSSRTATALRSAVHAALTRVAASAAPVSESLSCVLPLHAWISPSSNLDSLSAVRAATHVCSIRLTQHNTTQPTNQPTYLSLSLSLFVCAYLRLQLYRTTHLIGI
jgi:hypothetical protein